MAERTYTITVEVRCPDDLDDGTMRTLLSMASDAFLTNDVTLTMLAIKEAQ